MNKSQDEAKASGDGMTQSIRDAAQALIDCYDNPKLAGQMHQRIEALVSALSAPQPTADDRVAEHMRLAEVMAGEFLDWNSKKGSEYNYDTAFNEVEQSARALLSASQDDAEHAAMYRWLRSKSWSSEAYDYGCTDYRFPFLPRTNYSGTVNHATVDAAIRAAMSAKETKE